MFLRSLSTENWKRMLSPHGTWGALLKNLNIFGNIGIHIYKPWRNAHLPKKKWIQLYLVMQCINGVLSRVLKNDMWRTGWATYDIHKVFKMSLRKRLELAHHLFRDKPSWGWSGAALYGTLELLWSYSLNNGLSRKLWDKIWIKDSAATSAATMCYVN